MNLHNFLYKHYILCFFTLVTSGLTFGAMTVNLFRLVSANWHLIINYGIMAIEQGGLQQAIELIATGLLSMLFYLIFKLSEKVIVERIGNIHLHKNKR